MSWHLTSSVRIVSKLQLLRFLPARVIFVGITTAQAERPTVAEPKFEGNV